MTDTMRTGGIVQSFPDDDSDGIPDIYEHILLQKFRPYLRFTRDQGNDEHYNPCDVMFYLSCSNMYDSDGNVVLDNFAMNFPMQSGISLPILNLNWRNCGSSDIVSNPRPTDYRINPLKGFQVLGYSGSFIGRHGNSWQEIKAKRNIGLYGHVVPYCKAKGEFRDYGLDPNHTYYKVEYWQFFGYNNAASFSLCSTEPHDVGDHEGDWTSVQLLVDPDREDSIVSVFFYAHGEEFRYDMNQTLFQRILPPDPIIKNGTVKEYGGLPNPNLDVLRYDAGSESFVIDSANWKLAQNSILRLYRENGENDFTHPVVYVEYGTHEFFPSEYWSEDYAPKHTGDDTDSYFTETPPNLGEVQHPLSETEAAPIILKYNGYWGRCGCHNDPPHGPTLHGQWTWPECSPVRLLFPADYRPPF
jgi:hypothetical protein